MTFLDYRYAFGSTSIQAWNDFWTSAVQEYRLKGGRSILNEAKGGGNGNMEPSEERALEYNDPDKIVINGNDYNFGQR